MNETEIAQALKAMSPKMRQEVLRKTRNNVQAKQAYARTASPQGLKALFPGLKLG